jgi:hypothetical protein
MLQCVVFKRNSGHSILPDCMILHSIKLQSSYLYIRLLYQHCWYLRLHIMLSDRMIMNMNWEGFGRKVLSWPKLRTHKR